MTIEERLVAEQLAQVGTTLNGSNSTVHRQRQQAAEHFSRLGFPALKDEAWKYSKIRQEFDRSFDLATTAPLPALTPATIDSFAIPGLEAYRIVLINGRVSKELSAFDHSIDGFVLCDLHSAAISHGAILEKYLGSYSHADSEAFEALNTSFLMDGVFIHAGKSVEVDRPIHIVNLVSSETPVLAQPRIIVALEENASASIVETTAVVGNSDVLTNSLVELYVARHARLTHIRIQLEGAEATTVTATKIRQEESSYASTTTVTVGGRFIRNNLYVLPNAEHCESHLNGIVIASDAMHVDNHTSVDHAMPNCVSNELYKNILRDSATGVFNGRVLVRQDAQKTQAYQSNRAIVLSDDARMFAKPELEIYADDVLCSHGAATGRIDPESIFYLRSRGLSDSTARRLMLKAFSSDVTNTISIEPVREYVEALISDRI